MTEKELFWHGLLRRAGDHMAILSFMLGNLKKRKSYSIVICILVILAGLILNVSVSSIKNTNIAYDKAIDRINGPHLLYWIYGSDYDEKVADWFKARREVASEQLQTSATYSGSYLTQNNINYFDSGDIFAVKYDVNGNMRVIDGIHSSKAQLKKGEIYLPYIVKTNLGLTVGENIDFKYGSKTMHFLIAGFVEDPIFGGALVGVKNIFISSADFNEFIKSDNGVRIVTFLKIRLKNKTEDNILQVNKAFMKKYDSIIVYVNEYYSQKNFHLALPMVALGIMIAFSILLIVITLTIMRYAILSTIEADFVNIGILKALGFTPGMVQLAIVGQYAVLALLSGILSIVGGIFAAPLIGRLLLKSSGLYYTGGLSISFSILILLSLIAVIALLAYQTSVKTNSISPIRAISRGMAPNHFSSMVNIPLQRLFFIPFNMRMALKQIVTKTQRYFLLIIIAGLLAYALVFLFGVSSYFNGEKAINILGAQIADIQLNTKSNEMGEQLIKQITRDYDVREVYYESSRQILIEDERSVVEVSDDFDKTGKLKLIEGRHPKHDNEIAVSFLMESRYKKKIGDFLSLKGKDGMTHEFLITGVFQTILEGGYMGRITEEGMKKIDPSFELNEIYIKLKSNHNLDNIINQMKQRYCGYEEISNQYKETMGQLGAVRTVLKQVSQLVFVLTIIIISFITLLIMKVTVFGELTELGIYKAIGFSSGRLRYQLSLRFLLICLAGSLLGIGTEFFSGSALLSLSLQYVGIASVKLSFNAQNCIFATAAITILSLISAYISSSNTKTVTAYSLINE